MSAYVYYDVACVRASRREVSCIPPKAERESTKSRAFSYCTIFCKKTVLIQAMQTCSPERLPWEGKEIHEMVLYSWQFNKDMNRKRKSDFDRRMV